MFEGEDFLRWRAEKACDSKNWYSCQTKADKHARMATEKYGIRFRSYRCFECSGWHLTTKELPSIEHHQPKSYWKQRCVSCNKFFQSETIKEKKCQNCKKKVRKDDGEIND